MLDYKILSNKPYLSQNNEKYIDLLSKTYKLSQSPQTSVIVVSKEYVALPDLISLAIFGDDKYGDIICKFNGISNPFELNENMIIYIPSIENILESLIHQDTPSILANESDTIIDEKTYNDNRKKTNEKRTPNELTVGNSNFVIDRSLGLVFY